MTASDDGQTIAHPMPAPTAIGLGEVVSLPLTIVEAIVLPLVEERLEISTRQVSSGVVRIVTQTQRHDETAEVELDRYRTEVTRVPVGRVVDVAPVARAEGDTTVVPVVEERFVIVKQLFLKEEIHIRHVIEREMIREVVSLRRQSVTVERRDAAGLTVAEQADVPAVAGMPGGDA